MKEKLLLLSLFTYHADAWGLTLVIGLLCLANHGRLTPDALALVGLVATCYWLGFAVNDYFDAPYDAHDRRKARGNYFTMARHGRRVLLAAALCVALPVFSFFALRFGGKGVLVFAVAFFVLWAYSAPPLRLKSRPILDLLTHTLFVQTFPYAVCLFLLELPPTALDAALLGCFLLASLTAQLEQQARDYELDRATDRNFTTAFGLGTTTALLRLATLVLIAHALLNALGGVFPAQVVPFGLIAAPILLHRLVRDARTPRSERLMRVCLLVALTYAGVLLVAHR